MPLPKSKYRITLEEIGASEYWVEYHSMSGMKYKDVQKLFGDEVDDSKPSVEYVIDMLEKLVIAWNIPEEDGGEPLPIPAVDRESVGKLHNIVVTHLIEKMTNTGVDVDTINLDENS
tara:strand:+ start:3019 stop:3369 length:351 start_codon:yes stop_codon:yes gene_type:complete